MSNISLQEFLKKYSNVSNRFIDDFFGLYTIDTKSDDFVIDLDKLVKWLDGIKGHIKDTLIKSYQKNVDYKISKVKSNKAGKPREEILLTSDACKRLCMLSRTKKAEEVRTYFIELEKVLDKFKNYIIDGLQKRIHQLENNQKPVSDPKKGVIYVLKTDYDIVGLYKVGKTKKFKDRIKTHNTSHVDNVDIIYVYESDYIDEVEQCLKAVLKSKQYKKRKEFYQIDIDVLKELINNCDKMTVKVRQPAKKFKQSGGFYIMLSHEE